MNFEEVDYVARQSIHFGSELVAKHMETLREMVRIDSRSFNVNEFPGDRKMPSDMREILECAKKYLEAIGFKSVKINQAPPPGPVWNFPLLLADLPAAPDKPTVLFYAHLDKQPYMDDEKFEKWEGVPPTVLRWNADKTRAYGRGAADDLSGVIAIGLAVDALLSALSHDPSGPSPDLPCNIKVIFETEEECGSHSLEEQIRQNHDFFADVDCVIITDVTNPAQGIPGLTTSLRGIIQINATVSAEAPDQPLDTQTALYKLLATLIHDDHSLAVEAIARSDTPVSEEEKSGYRDVPTTVEALREGAGVLPATDATVQSSKEALLLGLLRRSYANARTGMRVAGGVIFGGAGARLTFGACEDPEKLRIRLENTLSDWNRFNLELSVTLEETLPEAAAYHVVLRSARKDPHSGMNGGPFPVPELQLAKMIDRLIADDGSLHSSLSPFPKPYHENCRAAVQPLFVDHDGAAKTFDDPRAKSIVEIRLAPGNQENSANKFLRDHLARKILPGFKLNITGDKGGSPWLAGTTHPVYAVIMDALEKGYGQKACLYGCGGSIPFVAKLMHALGDIQPMCLGAYDPDSRMHEPGESLSMPDLLGCSRSIVRFMTQAPKAYPHPGKNS